jgi:Glycosyl transferases group 1/Glycosyl transferase 4-like domain
MPALRTLHVCYSFLPDPPAGTELYVRALCRELTARGVDATIAAPGSRNEAYEVDGLRVRRFAHAPAADVTSLYAGDERTAEGFAALLWDEAPDILHQHALTPACSTELARIAKRQGCAVVFTYHTPTVSCQRGTLLEGGRLVCDGRMSVVRCTACALEGLGVGETMGGALARVPARMGEWLGEFGLQGGAWTALRMTDLVARHHREVADLFALADVVVALAPWTRDLLVVNGVPAEKIELVPHGIAFAGGTALPRSDDGRLKLVHLGRVDPTKGTALLIRALRMLPEAPVDLDVYGIVQDVAGATDLRQLKADANNDSRIRFLPALAPDEVIARLAAYDLVAVPSQWLETGPLVVLEAFAAGRPVLGSDLGGIADKVDHGRNGLLVSPYHSAEAWRDALLDCVRDRSLVARLTAGVMPPRAMAEVAADMAAIYHRLVAVGLGS